LEVKEKGVDWNWDVSAEELYHDQAAIDRWRREVEEEEQEEDNGD
jgi:hypothetical protein